MLDGLFHGEAPEWVDILFECLSKEITIDLAHRSETFTGLKKKIHHIFKEHPEFIPIIEMEEVQGSLNLSAENIKMLSELIGAEIEIMELYQRMLYVRGCRDGIRYAEYAGVTKTDRKGKEGTK